MKRYVVYDPSTGEIIQWGGMPGGLPEWDGFGQVLEHDVEGSLADYCVLDGTVVPKELLTLQVEWDGGIANVVGVPPGTFCTLRALDDVVRVTVNDGTLEVGHPHGAPVSITFHHPRYKIEPMQVIT